MRIIYSGEEFRMSFDKYNNNLVKLTIFDSIGMSQIITKEDFKKPFPFIVIPEEKIHHLPRFNDSLLKRGFVPTSIKDTYLLPEDIINKLKNEFPTK
jgi:hypothetical protein